MLEDFGNDALQELVVELDAASLEGLLEYVVDEAEFRLVAGLVAREHDDRNVEILIVKEREKRDARVCVSADARRIAGVLEVSDAHARTHVRRRRAVQD